MSRGALAIFALALGLSAGSAEPVDAVCGDTVLDVGEQCDDGNLTDGDCCTSLCEFEVPFSPCDHGRTGLCWSHTHGTCDGAGVCRPHAGGLFPPLLSIGSRLVLRDRAGTDGDSIYLKLRHGRYKCFGAPPEGDPSIDTAYGLCVWSTFDSPTSRYLDELVYELVIPPGAGWKPTRNGWAYGQRDETGGVQVEAKSLARFKARGAHAALPGPADATRYFATPVVYAIVNSAGFVNYGGGEGRRNTPDRYLAGVSSSCD